MLQEVDINNQTFMSVIRANMIFVMASATDSLAPAAGSSKPLIGCSPIAVAAPTWKENLDWDISRHSKHTLQILETTNYR